MKKRFNLKAVFRQREKIFLALKPYVDAVLSGQVFNDLFDDLYKSLPDTVSHDAVFESTRVLAGHTLTRREAAEFSWRLAGNMSELIAGRPVVPWSRQIRDEWVPVQIIRVDTAQRNNRHGYVFHCRALAGSPCTMVFEQFLSKGSCAAIARIAGFSRTMPYSSALHFANLRMWVELEAERSAEMPQFQQVDCTSAMRAYNKKLIGIRTRAFPCPRNFAHPCEHCELGYADCPAAIFPLRLERKFCPCCEEDNVYFDPARNTEACMSCAQTGATKKIAEA